jgi:hypothetical protein
MNKLDLERFEREQKLVELIKNEDLRDRMSRDLQNASKLNDVLRVLQNPPNRIDPNAGRPQMGPQTNVPPAGGPGKPETWIYLTAGSPYTNEAGQVRTYNGPDRWFCLSVPCAGPPPPGAGKSGETQTVNNLAASNRNKLTSKSSGTGNLGKGSTITERNNSTSKSNLAKNTPIVRQNQIKANTPIARTVTVRTPTPKVATPTAPSVKLPVIRAPTVQIRVPSR